MTKKYVLFLVMAIVILAGAILMFRFFIGGDEDTWLCQNNQWVRHGNPSAAMPSSGCGLSGSPQAGLANPASVNCAQKGGTEEIRADSAGGQYGVCKFSDGSECDSWKFFRGECSPR
jgi:putative hemolysin